MVASPILGTRRKFPSLACLNEAPRIARRRSGARGRACAFEIPDNGASSGTRSLEGRSVNSKAKDSGDEPRSSRPYQSFGFESWKCDFLNLNADVSRIVMEDATVDYLVLLAKFPQDNSNYKLAELAQKLRIVMCRNPGDLDDASRSRVRPVVHEQYMVPDPGGSCGLMIETASARQSLKQLIKETLGAEGEVMLLPSTMFGYKTDCTPASCVPQFPN